MVKHRQKFSDTHQRATEHGTRQDGQPSRGQQGKTQGIISDERGQTQPTDKARAQKSGTRSNPEKQPPFPGQPAHGE